MATVKVKFRPSSTTRAGQGTVFYQIIHRRVIRQINSRYRMTPDEWELYRSRTVTDSTPRPAHAAYLYDISKRIDCDITRLHEIIRSLEMTKSPYTSDNIIDRFTSARTEGLVAFSTSLISQLEAIGRHRTAENYATAVRSFRRFVGTDCDIPLDCIDINIIVSYEAHLKSRGLCPNSTSYYMRNLRAIYNRAADREMAPRRNPFKHVYTGIDRTVKRAVPLRVIKRIKELDLSRHPAMDYTRDIFMFSFYTRGMSFIDMAFLKKKDLRNGILTYRRHKTGQLLSIKWEKPMQDIVDKYSDRTSQYLFPIITAAEPGDQRRQYRNAAHLINNKLKHIGRLINSPVALTTYVARHAWASIARSKNIPISIISEAMGHESESTTRIYLTSFDTSTVDRANTLILKSL